MTKKIYNNKSDKFRDWTTAKLKAEAKNYHQVIYEVECFGRRDLMIYDGIMLELRNRGIEPKTTLEF